MGTSRALQMEAGREQKPTDNLRACCRKQNYLEHTPPDTSGRGPLPRLPPGSILRTRFAPGILLTGQRPLLPLRLPSMGSVHCCRRRPVPGLVRPQIDISICGLKHIGHPGYKAFEHTVRVDATVRQLKLMIMADPDHIDLFFEDVQLDDSRSLHSYSVFHGVTLGYCDRRDTPGR